MPTTLGKATPLTWRGKPPHMLPPDIPVWYGFLELYSSLIEKLWYEPLLGGPTYTPEQLKDPMTRMNRALLSLRPDAIAETEKTVWIIEVTSDARHRAIGQLMTYQAAWILDPKIDKPEYKVLVCSTMPPDFLDACGLFGIQVYIVKPVSTKLSA